MAPARIALPKDLTVAHEMIVELMGTVAKQQHELDRLKRYLFGRKSEKVLSEPGLLIGAGLLDPLPAEEPDPVEPEPEPAPMPAAPRASHRKRRPTPADLRIERIEHPLPPEACQCADCGSALEAFGEEVTRQLDYQPASFFLREHVRFKYACPRCKNQVVTSSMPTPPIAKGMPGAGLLAHVLTNKYIDHLPLYRQEQIFAREGIRLSRKTLCDWVGQCATLLLPIYEWMQRDLLASRLLHTDDTPILVQGKGKTESPRHQGRLWVYVGDRGHPQIVFDFTPNRCRDGPQRFLSGYRGYLQADAFPGYDRLYAGGQVMEVGCWAHCRRKFYDAQSSDVARTHQALAYIRTLYKVERECQEYETEQGLAGEARAAYRCAQRRERSQPIVDEFLLWLRKNEREVLPKSPVGEAIGYALGQWAALTRYLEDGELCIDNNPAEQAIRPLALGRKNWLFLGSDEGGQRAAVIYSLLATCKRHGVNPFEYLRDVLLRIADHSIARIQELTPLAWKQAHEQPPAETAAETV